VGEQLCAHGSVFFQGLGRVCGHAPSLGAAPPPT
jgi:hypothetical protein